MIGRMAAGWDPGDGRVTTNGGAVVITQQGSTTTQWTVRPVATATGTVRVIAGSAANNLFVAVSGQRPDGSMGTGGIYKTTNNAATWTTQYGIPGVPLILAFGFDGNGTVHYDPANSPFLSGLGTSSLYVHAHVSP
jgi:hypothetical protein